MHPYPSIPIFNYYLWGDCGEKFMIKPFLTEKNELRFDINSSFLS